MASDTSRHRLTPLYRGGVADLGHAPGGPAAGAIARSESRAFSAVASVGTSWVPVVLILCMIMHTLIPLPAELLAIAAGMLLGTFWGFVTIWVGAILGAYLGFFLARSFGQGLVQRLADQKRMKRLQGWLHGTDIPFLLALRLVPLISFNLVNFALGLTTLGWWRFTWTTAVGIVPATAVMVALGAHLYDWRVLVALSLAAIVVALGGYWVLRRRSMPSARVSYGAHTSMESHVSRRCRKRAAPDTPTD